MSYDISAIGNPYMSPLGALGLDGTSMYSSYGTPSMMGMGGMAGMLGSQYGMLGMPSMMGMYNPAFMSQMTQVHQDIEKKQLQHATDMHTLLLKNQVEQFNAEDRTLFEKAMRDAAVNKGVKTLAAKVREGDQDGICQEFEELKQTLYTKYADYFKENAYKVNPSDSVTNWIEILYGNIVSAERGEQVDFASDIKKYGETPFEHGFWKNLHGKDYHNKYSEETLSYIYGTNVDNKSGKDRMEKLGSWTERTVEGGVAALSGLMMGKLAKGMFCKSSKYGGRFGAALALAGDLWWQMSRNA